jgi:hypothetical protein
MENIKASGIKTPKFNFDDEDSLSHFVKEGFTIYQNVFEGSLILKIKSLLLNAYETLIADSKTNNYEIDNNGFAVSIVDEFTKTELYYELMKSKKLHKVLENILGPDIAIFDYDALWINVPEETDPVLSKNQHVDAWTGTSVNTIFAKLFFTDVDDFNGMAVSPRSHLQGLIPVRNREIDPHSNVEFDNLNLNTIKSGDLLVWHALLVHSTVGHSNKNIRISMTSRFTSTETEFSSQERALGYRTLKVGPLNQILRLIGNDLLSPFRTYGGFVGIDRRMADIYPFSDYKKFINYQNKIKDIFKGY